MTHDKLKSNTRKELAELAKQHHVAGWHGMRKDELVDALMDVLSGDPADAEIKTDARRPRQASSGSNRLRGEIRGESARPVDAPRQSDAVRQAEASRRNGGIRSRRKEISTVQDSDEVREELTVVPHDPHWLHARWVVKRSTIQRAAAALAHEWHQAVPVLRIMSVELDEVRTAKSTFQRDIAIHGDVDHWFVPVEDPPGHFRIELGYVTRRGRFYAVAKSKRVATPRPGSKAADRPGWNTPTVGFDTGRHLLQRSGGTDPEFEKFLHARALSYAVAGGRDGQTNVEFSLDCEVLISGTASPGTQVTIMGEPVKVGRDGRFSIKAHLDEGRQVVPAVAINPTGSKQQTIILAIERNTKELEPQAFEDLTGT